jgi:MOSC domain-containing protein YiiM
MSRVIQILISAAPSLPMEALESVRAVPGKGLEGDRYFSGIGTFSRHPQRPDGEITLIEKEKLDAFAASSGLAFTAHEARRNVVTEGVDLNSLVGKQFLLGEVLIQGLRLCEPCDHLAKTTFPEIMNGLVHQGGLRAQILSEGVIRVGDALVEKDPTNAS